MRTRTKWIVAGGAAALVITPVAAVYGSPTLETDLEHSGLVVDAEAANRARAARATPTPTTRPPARADAAPSTTAAKEKEPSGKKTVSAASPVSPRSPRSPKSPDTPG